MAIYDVYTMIKEQIKSGKTEVELPEFYFDVVLLGYIDSGRKKCDGKEIIAEVVLKDIEFVVRTPIKEVLLFSKMPIDKVKFVDKSLKKSGVVVRRAE